MQHTNILLMAGLQ